MLYQSPDFLVFLINHFVNNHTLERFRAADGLCAAEELYADGLRAAEELYLVQQEILLSLELVSAIMNKRCNISIGPFLSIYIYYNHYHIKVDE
jgi:flagellar biosynthesis regulator FlbT